MPKQINPYPECTNKCQSTQHGDALTSAITKRCVSDSDLCSFLNYMCCCCETVRDSYGRTVLHVAASCGRTDLVKWLIENRHANINMKDKESGYTALHRSIFYGKIQTAIELMKLGSSLSLQDFNGLTYLDHAIFDRFRPPEFVAVGGGEIFTWGANSNNSLGCQLPRSIPETMDIFHKEYPNEIVQDILINQFHSIILTDSGSVYSCGHGQGGRLGLGIKHAEIIPKLIKLPVTNNSSNTGEEIKVISCSIARDHSLFLTTSGEIFSCGLNKHKVLGISPPPEELLVPRVLKQLADERSFVSAGNYHSLFWNKSGIYTWGLNAGQLGHQLINHSDDKYIVTPKKVKCINTKENSIKFVCASTGATVVYCEKGDVYVLHEYQCRKIASRQLNLIQLAVIGGKLNYNLDPELSNKTRELKVAALTNTGSLLLWQETDPVLRRCVFSVNRSLNVKQMALNINHVIFVTNDGEAFKGEIKQRKKKPLSSEKDKISSKDKSDFHKFLEKDECVSIKLERIPRINRAVSIQSDPKGQNFGIVQDYPYRFFRHYEISDSTMLENLSELFLSADSCDGISDIEFRIGSRVFPAHKYILASRSHYFANLFLKSKDSFIEISGYHSAIFEEFLKYIYTGTTELIEIGELKNDALVKLCWKSREQNEKENIIIDENESAFRCYKIKEAKEKNNNDRKFDNPVRMLHELSKRFEVMELQKILSNLDMVKHTVRLKKDGKEPKRAPIIFNRNLCPELHDVEIYCKEDRVLRAHKCILAARMDYFCNMFSSRWRGGETSKITMPFAKGVVEALLEFLYTDSLDRLEEKDVDQLFKIIILSDQFFVTRLKDQCEIILSELLTIKNAVQLVIFADSYNADSLKENCFEFIQQNMVSFLELRLLEDLDSRLLKELSDFYQIRRKLDCRVITPYSTAVTDEEISEISLMCPVDITDKKEKSKEKLKTSSSKKRSRTQKLSITEKSISEVADALETSVQNISLSSDISEVEVSINDSHLANRLKAIVLANDISLSEEVDENYTVLNKKSESESLSSSFVDSHAFPLLCSPPKPSGFQSRAVHKAEKRDAKITKLPQKQRKRLSSESNNQVIVGSPPVTESPKNPWKILQDPVSPINSPQNDNIEHIISSEKKQKENLLKITSKQLVFTQLEDKAIEELRKFYAVDALEEEFITIERVSVGAVAVPIWVPKTK